jgi:DNA-binding MarR family transcriptional regulator
VLVGVREFDHAWWEWKDVPQMSTDSKAAVGSVPEHLADPSWIDEGVHQYTEVLETSDPKAIAVVLALWRAHNAQFVANSRAIDALDLPLSVTGTRLSVLRSLYFAPEHSMTLSNLSKAANVSPTMVTNLVDSLARVGLVRRGGSPDDRRVSIAHLTEEGEVTFLRVLPVLSQRMTDACAEFTDEEKDVLLKLLQRLF